MPLYYVSPKEAMPYIEERGILTPHEVMRLIRAGTVPREVLGVSYGMDSSNFPHHVSLLEDQAMAEMVAEQICFSRTGSYSSPVFMAIGYSIDDAIREHAAFKDNDSVRTMHPDIYPSEVLYGNAIPKEYIAKKRFAVRPFR